MIRLRLRAPTSLPLDMRALTPEGLAGKSEREIAGIALQHGNRKEPLGELFEIATGDASTVHIEASGLLNRVGQGMRAGRVTVAGDVGDHLGQAMRGGELHVEGSARHLAGSLAMGGVIRIAGDCGDLAGAALVGGRYGMNGGTILVGGSLGQRAGDRMRRGLIVAHGDAGDFLASRMLAGTIVVLGRAGIDPGFAMRRGTLLLATAPAGMLSTFADNGVHEIGWLGVLERQLRALDPGLAVPFRRTRRLTGCASMAGKGEILLANAA